MIQRDGYIKLTDFGLSKNNLSDKERTKSICGTPEYLAPEVLKKKAYGKEVDWWALGCLIFEMIMGYPPFFSENRMELFERIKYQDVSTSNKLSQSTRDIIKNLLTKNPCKRLGSKGVSQVQNHTWFQGVDWSLLQSKSFEPCFMPKVTQEGLENFDEEFVKAKMSTLESMGSAVPSFSDFSWQRSLN